MMNRVNKVLTLFNSIKDEFELKSTSKLVIKDIRPLGRSYIDGTVELRTNFVLFGNDVSIERVLRHEMAHLLALKRYGMKAWNHGELWKLCAVELGIKPYVRMSKKVAYNGNVRR